MKNKRLLTPEELTQINGAMPSDAKYGEVFQIIAKCQYPLAYQDGAEATADAFIEAGKEIATREILALTENIFNLAINGDYTNGNDAYGLDEGRVRASELIEDFDKQLEALKQKYL